MGKQHNWKPVLILAIGILVLAATVLTAGVGAGGGRVVQTQQSKQQLRIGEVPALAKSQSQIAQLDPAQEIRMMISFHVTDEAGLEQLIEDLNDPASPVYHQWLTPEEFGQRFGRSETEFNQALSWLQSQGFNVDRPYPNRLAIGFTGTTAVIEQAFGVQMGLFWDSNAGRSFYSNINAPTLPAELSSITVGLQGLNNAFLYRHTSGHRKLRPISQEDMKALAGTGGPRPDLRVGTSANVIGPSDLAALYDYLPLWNANFKGSGQKVGIIIDSDILDSDMAAYRSLTGLPANTVQRVLLPGFSNPGVTAGEDEADEDTQSVSAVAPMAEIDLILLPMLDSVSILTAESDIVNQVATLNIHIVNESFGLCESEIFDPNERTVFQQAVAQGIAIFASSGDEGANCDEGDPTLHGVECPACYDGATAVGGTTLNVSYNTAGVVTARTSEFTWNTPPGVRQNCTGGNLGGGSTGGGVSAKVSMPTYQVNSQGFATGVPAGSMRVVPDIAAIADPNPPSGCLLVVGGQGFYGGGTSQSSPLWAGMMALINNFKGSVQGSPNTALYQLGVNQFKNGGPAAYLDITSGNNNVGPVSPCLPGGFTGFSAKSGYDPVTGWGVPDLNVIAHNFGGAQAPNYIGYVDHAGCDSIGGWAADRNRLNTSINVEIYDGTTLISTVLASSARSDVGAFLGDNGMHGFSIPTPASLKDGATHSIHIKFETSSTELSGSPAPISCTGTGPNYIGFVDHAGCDTIAGWAADRNRLNTAINIEIYDGSTLIEIVTANNTRADVGAFLGDNGVHGFAITTPASLRTGTAHSVHVKFESSATELSNSPASLNCTSFTPNYVGYVDHIACDSIGGWVADRNRLNTSITVSIYANNVLIATVQATALRSDVGAFLGDNGQHGFSIPTPASLKGGVTTTVNIRFEASTTDLFNNSPFTLFCP